MLEWIITSSVLILILIGLRAVLRRHISPRLQYLLWALVLIRLLVPFSLPSQTSVANFIPQETSLVLNEPIINTVPVTLPDLEIPQQTPPVIVEPEQNLQDDPVQEQLTQITQDMKESVAWSDVLGSIWVLGMILMAGVLLCSNLRFLRKLRRTRTAIETDCTSLPVYQCSLVKSPCLFGLFRPSVYLTSEVLESQTLTRYVLAHELAHFRTKDHIWSLLRSLCLVIHWYNPLVWVAAVLSKRDAESWCDESAIHSLGEETRQGYGQALIRMSCIKKDASALLTTATTMSSGKKALKDRINLIAKHPKTAVYTLILVVVLSLVAVGCTFTGQQETEPTESTEITEPMDDGLIISLNGFSYVLDPDWVIGNPMPEHFTGEGLVWDKEDSAEPDGLPHGTKLFYSDEDTAYIFYLLPSESDPVRLIRQDILQLQENPPTEPDGLQPTGYPDDEIQVTLAYVNGQLYIHDTLAQVADDVPDGYMDNGIIRHEYNQAVPKQERHACHLPVGTSIYVSSESDTYIYYWCYPKENHKPRRMIRYDLSGYTLDFVDIPEQEKDHPNNIVITSQDQLQYCNVFVNGLIYSSGEQPQLSPTLPDGAILYGRLINTEHFSPSAELEGYGLPDGISVFLDPDLSYSHIYCQVPINNKYSVLVLEPVIYTNTPSMGHFEAPEITALPDSYDAQTLVTTYATSSHTWTDNYGNQWHLDHSIPNIYPFSADAIRVQAWIHYYMYGIMVNAEDAVAHGISAGTRSIAYESYLNGTILSVIISQDIDTPYTLYTVFNFDLTTGKLLDNDALLNHLNISQQDYLSRAKPIAKEIYEERFSQHANNSEAESFYQQQFSTTLADENLLGCYLYLDQNSNLVAILRIYPLAGPSYYELPTTIFQASELIISDS